MERYPNISEHGLIGDLQTCALVTSEGTVDFFCCPRFDSPSVFASLLDAERGGYFSIKPANDGYVTKQLYFPDTAMLITRFMTKDGVGEVLDFMPVIEGKPTNKHRLVRHLRVARGTMQFELEIQPRFNYGRASHTVEVTDNGAIFRADDGMHLTLHLAGKREGKEQASVERAGDGFRATFTMQEGDSGRGIVLESMGGEPKAMTAAELEQMANDTSAYWKTWLGRSTYQGRWREMVNRSAMTLKLLTYEPTGAPVAAATFGLPEQTGGERNWDYRFTWIRDASLTMHALGNLGYLVEAGRFSMWLRDRVAEHVGSASGPLKIMYRVDGTSDLVEETLDHFEGWRSSRPVRIGNGAADQLQLDIYGEAMDAIYNVAESGLQIAHQGWQELSRIIDWVADNWDQPDEGIWETRGGRQDFTYGRFQCWVALDRAIRMAEETGRPANLPKWAAERDRLYNQIMDRGWNPAAGAFVQHYGANVMDSSLLLMPLEGFVAAQDPMWLSTLRAIDKQLVSDSLVYRYNPAASPDGLHGDEGTFSLCTFLYVDALARSGRLDEAVLTFEKMQTYGNNLGLFSEEIGPTGEQLGNFPQAFTHLSLINAAITLNRELDRRAAYPERVAAIEQLAGAGSGPSLSRTRVEATVAQEFDVIIVGTGAGGGTLARTLATTGKNILLLERGDFLTRELENWDPRKVFIDGRYISADTWYDAHGTPFQPQAHYFVGGATKVYGAALYRLRPADFGEIRYSGGVSPSWPVSYDEFEPYYSKAEWLYQVHGTHGLDPTEGRWSRQYPWPPVSHEPRIEQLSQALQRGGYHPFPAPCGILLDEGDRPASQCIRCGTCDGYPCLVHAKADADIIGIRPLIGMPNVTLLTGAEVVRLETDPGGRVVTGVAVNRGGWGRAQQPGDPRELVTREDVYHADIVVLAAGAANTAKILLRSASDAFPSGLANGSDQVGRNYMFHNSKAVVAIGKEPNDTVFQKTLSVNDFYLRGDSREWPLGNIQLLGKSRAAAIHGEEPSLTKLAPMLSLEEIAHHCVDFWLTTEDIPNPGNRVTVDRDGNIHLAYATSNETEAAALYAEFKTMLNHVGLAAHHVLTKNFYMSKNLLLAGVAHQAGTCRFGTDPATSVLDANCKAHEVDNLYVADTSVFPSIGAVSPALTAMANAIRVGEHIAERLGTGAAAAWAPPPRQAPAGYSPVRP